MDTTTIATVSTIISVCFVVASFLVGQLTARSKSGSESGERWGKLESNLDYIKIDLQEIKTEVAKNSDNTRISFEKMKEEYKNSIRRVHDRLDSHLQNDHNIAIPKHDQ